MERRKKSSLGMEWSVPLKNPNQILIHPAHCYPRRCTVESWQLDLLCLRIRMAHMFLPADVLALKVKGHRADIRRCRSCSWKTEWDKPISPLKHWERRSQKLSSHFPACPVAKTLTTPLLTWSLRNLNTFSNIHWDSVRQGTKETACVLSPVIR